MLTCEFLFFFVYPKITGEKFLKPVSFIVMETTAVIVTATFDGLVAIMRVIVEKQYRKILNEGYILQSKSK